MVPNRPYIYSRGNSERYGDSSNMVHTLPSMGDFTARVLPLTCLGPSPHAVSSLHTGRLFFAPNPRSVLVSEHPYLLSTLHTRSLPVWLPLPVSSRPWACTMNLRRQVLNSPISSMRPTQVATASPQSLGGTIPSPDSAAARSHPRLPVRGLHNPMSSHPGEGG